MRILHIDSGLEMRGGQWQVLYLLEQLARAGHQVCLLSPRSSPLAELALSQDLAVRPLGPSSLARLGPGFDLVHAHDARSHWLAALLVRRPLVVSRRVAFPVRRNPVSRWKYRRPAHFIAISQFVREALLAAGIAPDRIAVVYDGVPLPDAISSGGRIVAPATDDPRKGTALLRQAAALGGFEVHFSSHLSQDLAGAGIFVYITHQEGLGSAVLLAMAAGVPVVTSRTGGLPEAVRDGQTGLLVDNAPEAIAAAVARLAADRPLALRLAACARRRAEETFSVAAMVRGTLQVYHRVLSC